MDVKNLLRPYYTRARYYFYRIRYLHQIPEIYDSLKTLDCIIQNKLSISRYGDGELYLMSGAGIRFCGYDRRLADKLIQAATIPIKGHLPCIPPMLDRFDGMKASPKSYWKNTLSLHYPIWIKYFQDVRPYGSSFVSRYYMDFQNKGYAYAVIDKWKQVWNDRDVLIIEGENTRIGIGNDLMDNAKSISRILCPPINAFNCYDRIISAVQKYYNGQLVLIALGPTATAMAYDLCKLGIQSIDIGHIDIEYEWLKLGTDHKVDIATKAVNEVKGNGLEASPVTSNLYLAQILTHIK